MMFSLFSISFLLTMAIVLCEIHDTHVHTFENVVCLSGPLLVFQSCQDGATVRLLGQYSFIDPLTTG